jgi:hypothetical protein
LLVRDYKRKEADRLVPRIDPSLFSLVAELRGYDLQAAEEVEQWKTVSPASSRAIAPHFSPSSRRS